MTVAKKIKTHYKTNRKNENSIFIILKGCSLLTIFLVKNILLFNSRLDNNKLTTTYNYDKHQNFKNCVIKLYLQ